MYKKELVGNRMEFMVAVIATMCNSNGNPDMANAPHFDPDTGYGYINADAFKSWIRGYVGDAYEGVPGFKILYSQNANLNKAIAEAVLSVHGVKTVDELPKDKRKKDGEKPKPLNTRIPETVAYMCQKYWDARTFGAVLSTGLNAGQIKGPVQIGIAKSVSPIRVEEITVSRKSYTDPDWKNYNTLEDYEAAEKQLDDSAKHTFGSKQIVKFGLYVIKGSISAPSAARYGFTTEDLRVLCEGILQALPFNESSSKFGMQLASPLILFKHVGTQSSANAEQNMREARYGCARSQDLYNLLTITEKDGVDFPDSVNDYNITFNLSKLPKGVEVGFKYLPYEEFVWGDDIRKRDYGIEIC